MWGIFEPQSAHPGWPYIPRPLQVRAGTVRLREAKRRDGRAWSALRLADQDYLQPWEPTADRTWEESNGRSAWPGVYISYRRAAVAGSIIPLLIELNGYLCGQLTIGGITRGSLRSGWIGYWVSRRYSGGGIASAALALGVDHALGEAQLHRIDATVRPENTASRVVLERCGFREEGKLQRYLHVDGAWRDHLLMARTAEEQGRGAVALLLDAGVARLA